MMEDFAERIREQARAAEKQTERIKPEEWIPALPEGER